MTPQAKANARRAGIAIGVVLIATTLRVPWLWLAIAGATWWAWSTARR
jgi:hypothetical protein